MSYLTFAKEMLKNLFSSPATTQYPLQPKEFAKGVRGKVLNDIDNCIFCGMCQRNCPADAIVVDRTKRTWTINPFSCVQCQLCVDNCPKKCLHMEEHYTEPALEKADVVMEGKPLPPPAEPKA
ncbi:MAG: 4Fe-4S dicluster domain-containing protein [Acidaminococcaceae bacterium]|nr:4Fe-4S dicluster domain-containing protein [Acidaminococcaceae bacterium]MDO4936069.1 4Fe-4S dicluster domain-containing protein [Phascolarctobacterium sp.]